MTGFITKKLTRPRSLGSIFRAARSKANVTLEDAERETAICLKYLSALEAGDYAALPADAYNVGFVRTYAQFLKLQPEKILKMYREERSQSRITPERSVSLAPKKIGDLHFLVTPKLVGIVATVIAFTGMVGYVAAQLREFSSPPSISLNSPTEFTSSKDTVSLSGRTAEGSTVTMNAEPVLTSTDGSFNQDIQLSPGVNEILIKAKSRAEKESQVAVKVLYDKGVATLLNGSPVSENADKAADAVGQGAASSVTVPAADSATKNLP